MSHFADRLNERITLLKTHLVIGIDPDPARLFSAGSPLRKAFGTSDEIAILHRFCATVLDAASGTACAVKPQSAFFESMGTRGLGVLADLIAEARSRGIIVILDAKRGDIGNTARAYAEAYLNRTSPLQVDALTVNPYLGPDTLLPFVEIANGAGNGLFVLVKTSNPGSGTFQDTPLADGRPLYEKVAEVVAEIGQANPGSCGYSNVGAVCGATFPQELSVLRKLMPKTIFLVPGYGAQGGTAEDVGGAFNPGGAGAIVSSSRGVIFAYEKEKTAVDPESIEQAILKAAIKAREDIERVATSSI